MTDHEHGRFGTAVLFLPHCLFSCPTRALFQTPVQSSTGTTRFPMMYARRSGVFLPM